MWKGHSTNVHFDKAVFGLLFLFYTTKNLPSETGGKKDRVLFTWE